jgi:hypothetical protein
MFRFHLCFIESTNADLQWSPGNPSGRSERVGSWRAAGPLLAIRGTTGSGVDNTN